ncbi:MAG: isopenicillin N synthase family oxygenase [Actinomyces sp.]|nr:MAG: isopenicillin N synthase family oxygenase [Actinomyces sp.]
MPTVDLSGWWEGTAAEQAAVAANLDDACRRLGFLQLAGHRIPGAVIAAMERASAAFFDLPLEAKMAVRPADLGANRGYSPPGAEALAYSLGEDGPPDLFEAFNIGEDEVDTRDPFYAAQRHRFFAPNVWPSGLPGFRHALVAYFREARRVALTLTEVFAVALGLEPGWFRPFVDRSTTTMRIIDYRAGGGRGPGSGPGTVGRGAAPSTDPLGMGAHTDYGVVTVLWADGRPGLQILDPDGRWRDVRPDPGKLLVNLGDLTAEWTNDRWRSTLHRVLPPSAVGIERRRSTAFFLDANWDAIITCVPTCTGPDRPPRYPPVVAGEHLMAKLMGPRELRRSTAVDTARDRRP